MKKNKKIKYITSRIFKIWLIVIIIAFTSIGFASYSSNLTISTTAEFRPIVSIRLNGIEYQYGENNGREINNSLSYSQKSFTTEIELPNANSKVIYKIKVSNYIDTVYGIASFENIPDSLQIKTLNYQMGEKMCDKKECVKMEKEILIEISYKQDKYDGINTSFSLISVVNFKPVYQVNYKKFQNIVGFPNQIMEGNTFKLNYLVDDDQYLAIYMNNALLDSNEYSYENGELTIENVQGNLDIELKNFDSLKENEKIGSITYENITVTSYGNGIYSIDGTVGDTDIFIRLSDYLIASNNKNDLMSAQAPNNNAILQEGKHYDITFSILEGSHNVNTNNKARFVFRKVNNAEGYQLFGYDFYSGAFGSSEFPLEDDLGMYSLFLGAGYTFDNFKFKISINEVQNVEIEDYGPITDTLSRNNFYINFYDQTNTIEFNGTNNSELFIDLTNRVIYTQKPDTSAITEPLYKAGDNLKITYEFIKNYPITGREVAFPLRNIDVSSGAIDISKITSKTYDLNNNIVKEFILDEDASIFCIYLANSNTFNHYKFKISIEKIVNE